MQAGILSFQVDSQDVISFGTILLFRYSCQVATIFNQFFTSLLEIMDYCHVYFVPC